MVKAVLMEDKHPRRTRSASVVDIFVILIVALLIDAEIERIDADRSRRNGSPAELSVWADHGSGVDTAAGRQRP
jgi:hypothetical protein